LNYFIRKILQIGETNFKLVKFDNFAINLEKNTLFLFCIMKSKFVKLT